MKTWLAKRLLRPLLRLDTWFYSFLSRVVVQAYDGVHPKHVLTEYHAFFVDRIPHWAVVLDLGCGNGLLTEHLAQKASEVIGIDSLFRMRVNRTGEENFCFWTMSADQALKKFAGQFEMVVCSNVLEHTDPLLLWKIRESGAIRVLLRTPAFERDWRVALKASLGLPYFLDPDHRIEYTELELRSDLEQAGWTITEWQQKWGEYWVVAE